MNGFDVYELPLICDAESAGGETGTIELWVDGLHFRYSETAE